MLYRAVLIFSILISAISCSDPRTDTRLLRIEEMASLSPKDALDSLEAISYDLLSDADKNYYDFLSVKVPDKAYVLHTSDSLILKVIDFETRHQANGRYPEALYYGGRVYSDLGDYPTALKYFQNALDLTDDSRDIRLRNRILSQTGRLLNTLRLYDKAIPYVQDAIRLDSVRRDTVNYMYDIQLLGAIYLHSQKLEEAKSCFNDVWRIAAKVLPKDTLQAKMYLAAIQYKKHNIDSALFLIRGVPREIHPLSRNMALAYAARIYMASEKYDSAYSCALQIIQSRNPNNRKAGYQILMSDRLRTFIPADSIGHYLNEYSSILEDYFDQNQKESFLLQNSYYNYQTHVRELRKVEHQRSQLIGFAFLSILVLLLLVIVILILKYRHKSRLIRLREALDNIERLHDLLKSRGHNQGISGPDAERGPELLVSPVRNQDATELKTRLRQELIALSQTQQPEVSMRIIQSEAYAELQTYVQKERFIADSNPLWMELESVVLEESKNFKEHLILLTGGALRESTYHLALLLKCGVTPTQLTSLIGKTKGTISYQRTQLCIKVLGENMGAKMIDDIIRLL